MAKISEFRWYVGTTGYATTVYKEGGKIKHLRMHHLVYGHPKNGLVIDHINRDKLDNRKNNLRYATQTENMMNTDRVENAKGYYRNRRGKWVVDYRGVSNIFHSEDDAIEAVKNIRAGTFIKRKDVIRETCQRCGNKKEWYGGIWQCRKCCLQRCRESYARRVTDGRIKLHPKKKKEYCLRGHPRTPDNLTKNGTCKICAKERSRICRDQKRESVGMKKPTRSGEKQ